MLYNVYINGGVAIKVTEYNAKCTPCNEIGSVPSEEKRVMNIVLPPGFKNKLYNYEEIKKYINLNNLL